MAASTIHLTFELPDGEQGATTIINPVAAFEGTITPTDMIGSVVPLGLQGEAMPVELVGESSPVLLVGDIDPDDLEGE